MGSTSWSRGTGRCESSCPTPSASSPRPSWPTRYRRAAVVVCPSRSEGFGIVLRAMAHGKPVVATAVGGLQELVRHARTGASSWSPATRRHCASRSSFCSQTPPSGTGSERTPAPTSPSDSPGRRSPQATVDAYRAALGVETPGRTLEAAA